MSLSRTRLGALFLCAAWGSLAAVAQAQPARPNFQLPFACGARVPLSTYAGHGDYEIDMIVPSGTPVLAVAAGTAYRGHSRGGGYQVSILHANGWRSLYLHLTADSYQFADGAHVEQGQVLALSDNTGENTGDTPHLHYEQQLSSGGSWKAVHAWFNGAPSDITDDARANSYEDTSHNCPGDQPPPATVPSGDGSLIREPDGSIAVLAGGAAFSFSSMEELRANGYDQKPWASVPAGHIAGLPTTPRDGTLLRDKRDGSIAVVVNGAALWISSWDEYLAAGYGPAAFVNVPRRYIDAFPHSPTDGSLLRDKQDGSIMVVAGGARFWIQSWPEYVATGYGAFTNVPRRIIDALPTTPRDGTLLRDPADGTIVHIQAGTKYAFASWQELVDAGFEASVFIDVPRRVIDHFPSRASLNAAPANPPDPSLGAGDYGVNYPHGVGAVDYMYGRDGTWRTLTDVLYHWNYYPEYASAKHPFDKEMLLATADGTRNTTAPDANGHLLLDFDHDGEIDVWDAGGAFYEHNARTKGNLIKNQYQPNEQKPFTNFWFDDNWLARYMAQAYGRPLPAGLSDYDDFTRWQVLGADTQHWTPYQGAAPDQLALNGLYYLAVGHIHAAVGAWKDLLAASDFDGASGDYTGIGENYHLGLFKILTDKLLASGQVPSTDSSNFVQHSVALRSAILRNQQKTGAGAYAGWTTDVAANGLMNTESLAVNVLALATGAKTTFGAGHAPLRHTAENSYRLGAVGESLSAVPGTSLPGHITFGPNFSYPAGTYTVEFVVRAHNPQGDVANLDVYDATSGRVLAERKLTVTDLGFDVWQRVALTIQVATAPNSLEFRTWWYGGNSRLDVAEIRVR